jgi:hypothetical protein
LASRRGEFEKAAPAADYLEIVSEHPGQGTDLPKDSAIREERSPPASFHFNSYHKFMVGGGEVEGKMKNEEKQKFRREPSRPQLPGNEDGDET